MRRSELAPAFYCAAAFMTLGASSPASIGLPEGYRHWTHVRSAIVHPPSGNPPLRFDGLHHIYANEIAMAGYRTGKFPDGAVLVFDRFSVKSDPRGIEPTERLSVDIMVRDSGRFTATGGWGFERFGADGRTRLINENEREQCAACHRRVESGSMVFSRFDE